MENRLQSGLKSGPSMRVGTWPFHHFHGPRVRSQELAPSTPVPLADSLGLEQERRAFALAANAIREEEKARVARELHDELAQALSALKMDTLWVREHAGHAPEAVDTRLAGMVEIIERTVSATRRIAADLRPMVLDDLGMLAAIEWLVDSFTQRSGVPCKLSVDESLELALPDPYATAVFRIVQESLANVAKHAAASQVWVCLDRTSDGAMLRVQDNGCGFITSAPRKPQSLGLMGLRERAQLLGGSVAINSVPGQGSCVEVHIPLTRAQTLQGGCK